MTQNPQPTRRNCDQLGVCQSHTPLCANCPLSTPLLRVQPPQDAESTDSNSWDQIGTLLAQAAVAVGSVAVMFGVAGYLWGQP